MSALENFPKAEVVDILSAADLTVGDIVEFIPKYAPKYAGRAYRVERILPKNVAVADEDGALVRTDPFMLVRSTRTFTKSNAPTVMFGSLVRVNGRLTGEDADQMFVVLALPKNGKVKIARVGGDRNRYFNVPTTALVAADDL